MDLFLTNTQFVTLIDVKVNWWTGVMWIIVMFLSVCLDSHSDGTHSLQRIHRWANDVMLHFSKSDLMKKNSSISWMAWGWVHFQQIFILRWTIPLRFSEQCCTLLILKLDLYHFSPIICWKTSTVWNNAVLKCYNELLRNKQPIIDCLNGWLIKYSCI